MKGRLWLCVCLLTAGLFPTPHARAAQVVFDKTLSAAFTTLDPAGNIYVASGLNLVKFDPSGNVVFSRALPGGIVGNWSQMSVNAAGEVVIVGNTQYDTLPTTPNAIQPQRNNQGTCISGDKNQQRIPCTDAFIVKLDANGNLAWATYLGGPGNDGAIAGALDASGNVYVAGGAQPGFPVQGSLVTAGSGMFLAKINPTGTKLVFSTFLASAGSASPVNMKLDANGDVYLAGNAQNVAFPAAASGSAFTCPAQVQATDAFFAKVSGAGDRIIFAGCLGGNSAGYTSSSDFTLDSTGSIYLTGTTNAAGFPLTPGSYQPGVTPTVSGVIAGTFVSKISPDGANLVYSSLFGGGPGRLSIAIDRSGAAYVAGQLYARTFPIAGPARQTCPGPEELDRRFLVKLSADGSTALYSSFDDPTVAGVTLAIGPDDALIETYLSQPSKVNDRLLKIANLDQGSGPLFSPLCVLNGASFASHYPGYPLLPGISPGQIVTLKGVGLGPTTGAGPSVTAGVIDSSDGAVQVFFDGVAAPLLYVQDRQINVVAPYGLAGKTQTWIQVTYAGQTSLAATLPVSTVSPALFLNFASGQPLVFNADFTLNAPTHPLTAGWVLALFLTGSGQTSPASFDGEISPGPGGLVADVSAKLEIASGSLIDLPLTIQYAGPSPGLTSSVQQINVLMPDNLPPSYFGPGSAAYLLVTIGGRTVTAQVYAPGPN